MRGNVEKVMAAAAEIVSRLRKTHVTLGSLIDEYHVAYPTMVRAIRTQVSEKQFKALMRKRLGRGGKKYRFKPGHESWNKGRKGLCSPGCKATQFKAGTIRGAAARNYRPVGSITVRRDIDRDGKHKPKNPRLSRWIKVCDDGRPQDRYIPYARYVWEQEHGPVPEGCFVGHRDNDTMNDSPGNLILVHSRREHILRLYDRPDVIRKCRARSSDASKQRHAENRSTKRWAKAMKRQIQTVYECGECGANVPPETEQCPKCGAWSIARREIKPMPDSMTKGADTPESCEGEA